VVVAVAVAVAATAAFLLTFVEVAAGVAAGATTAATTATGVSVTSFFATRLVVFTGVAVLIVLVPVILADIN
jgi:hypothetical protein